MKSTLQDIYIYIFRYMVYGVIPFATDQEGDSQSFNIRRYNGIFEYIYSIYIQYIVRCLIKPNDKLNRFATLHFRHEANTK